MEEEDYITCMMTTDNKGEIQVQTRSSSTGRVHTVALCGTGVLCCAEPQNLALWQLFYQHDKSV